MSTAFIGLDYIYDIVHPEGKIAKAAGHALDEDLLGRINHALTVAHQNGWLIILVKVGFAPGYVNLPKNSPFFGSADTIGALELGTKGTEFHPGIKTDLADTVVVKPRVSAFYNTDLESILNAQNIERIIFAGVSTAWAVQASARDAHDRDYDVVIAEDACAAATETEHQESISLLSKIAKIAKVEELLKL